MNVVDGLYVCAHCSAYVPYEATGVSVRLNDEIALQRQMGGSVLDRKHLADLAHYLDEVKERTLDLQDLIRARMYEPIINDSRRRLAQDLIRLAACALRPFQTGDVHVMTLDDETPAKDTRL
jgi:hypothetical protein